MPIADDGMYEISEKALALTPAELAPSSEVGVHRGFALTVGGHHRHDRRVLWGGGHRAAVTMNKNCESYTK